MPIDRAPAQATTATPADRVPVRALVVGLALLFSLSASPVEAALSEDRERAISRGGGAWLVDLEPLIEKALMAVPGAARVDVDSPAAQAEATVGRRQQALEPFRMNLFRKGDFSSQRTAFWCIPASTQMMMNMMDSGRPNRSRSMQRRLYRIGDRLEEDGTFSPDPEPDLWRGMGISEWVGLLNRYEYGPYELAGSKSFRKTLRQAARMMRTTGKPVGLVVWRGAHAWVMSGFEATADPAVTSDFEITAIWVQDPWYPRTSSIWGRSRGPNAKVSPQVLRRDFKRYGRPGRRNPERDGRFMLVLPRPDRVEAAAA